MSGCCIPQYRIIAATAVTDASNVGKARLKPGWSIPSRIFSIALDEEAIIPDRVLTIAFSASIFSTFAMLHLSNGHIHNVFVGA